MHIIAKACFGIFVMFLFTCQQTNPVNEQTKVSPDKVETPMNVKKEKSKVILFFGNSLTAAYGIDPSEGFVALTQNKLDSMGLDYKVVNSGISGETTAGGESRIDWILDQYDVDIFILELGGNDGLRGIKPEETYTNLQAIIDKVKAKDPDTKIVLAGMMAPPNMGPEFTNAFRDNYPRLAKENNTFLIPFLLDKVAGERELNLPDGIHPTAEGHALVAETIWETLSTVVE